LQSIRPLPSLGHSPDRVRQIGNEPKALGHIFHIISYGRGVMPSYASQIGPTDRWNIITYLRQLQADNAKAQTAQK